jgi:hypothetical protein
MHIEETRYSSGQKNMREIFERKMSKLMVSISRWIRSLILLRLLKEAFLRSIRFEYSWLGE